MQNKPEKVNHGPLLRNESPPEQCLPPQALGAGAESFHDKG
jgi:hypothetical protein